MNLERLILLEILVLGIIGVPLAMILGDSSYLYQYLFAHYYKEDVINSYLLLIYSITILVIFYNIFIKKKFISYFDKPNIIFTQQKYLRIWMISIFLALICGVILFIQNSFTHPLFSRDIFYSAYEFAFERQLTISRINPTIYNLGLHLFLPAAMFISIFYLKKTHIIVLTICFFLLFATFSLAKSPIVDVIIQMFVLWLLVERKSYKLIKFFFIVLFILLVFILITSNATSFNVIFNTLIARLFVGEFGDLPSYFKLFHNQSASLLTLLPPYIQSFLGINVSNLDPGKMVIEYTLYYQPRLLEIAGVANTFFIGTAYAYWGMIGVILSPVLVFLNFYVVVKLFKELPRNFFTIFLFGYLIYRLSASLSSGMSYFSTSGIQIMILLVYLAKKNNLKFLYQA